MTRDIDTLFRWIKCVLSVAAFFTTAFPVLWLFSKWNSTEAGRLLMFQTTSFALVLDCTLLFQFWTPNDILVIFWVNVILFSLIAFSSGALLFMLWTYNYHPRIFKKRGNSGGILQNRAYDKLKWVALVGRPGATTLYAGMAVVWHLPSADAVVASGVLLDTALGTWLHIDTKNYNDGDLNIIQDPQDGATAVQVNANEHPAGLEQGQKVVLKVNKVQAPSQQA
jgi:hypothetical protein